MHDTAENYYSQGNLAEAKKLFEECLERQRQNIVLGDDHPSTLRTMNSLAFCYYSQGNYDEAKKLREECLERQSNVLAKTSRLLDNDVRQHICNQNSLVEQHEMDISGET